MKDCEPEEVKSAIEAVMHRGYYHSDLLSARLIHHLQNDSDTDPSNPRFSSMSLSKKEITFLKWICSDLTYKEIAGRMFVSPRTVDGYRDELFEKLQMRSRIGLAIYAIKNGLVTV